MAILFKATIPGSLPSMNEYSDAQRVNRYKGANMKKKATYLCRDAFLLATDGIGTFETIDYQVVVDVVWYCKDRRKDPDNIISSLKFILDGLQKAEIIKGDGWRHISSIKPSWEVDKENPRIEVMLRECK